MNRHRVLPAGFALPLVLWLIALITVSVGLLAYAASARHLQSSSSMQRVQAEAAAEAGIAYATARLDSRLGAQAWKANGDTHAWRYGDFEVRITLRDEAGKLDVNAGDLDTLRTLLMAMQVDDAQASALLHGIEASRQARLFRQEGMQSQLASIPTQFRSLASLSQLPGVQPDTITRLAPELTVHSGRTLPEPTLASPRMRDAMRAMGTPLPDAPGSGLYEIEAIALRAGKPAGRMRVVLQWALRSDGIAAGPWLAWEHGLWQ